MSIERSTREEADAEGIVVSTAITAGGRSDGSGWTDAEGIVVSTAITAGGRSDGSGWTNDNHSEGIVVSTATA